MSGSYLATLLLLLLLVRQMKKKTDPQEGVELFRLFHLVSAPKFGSNTRPLFSSLQQRAGIVVVVVVVVAASVVWWP